MTEIGQQLADALERISELESLLEDAETVCPVHGDSKHGLEAEELRQGIEKILNEADEDIDDMVRKFRDLLEDVDARDAIVFIDRYMKPVQDNLYRANLALDNVIELVPLMLERSTIQACTGAAAAVRYDTSQLIKALGKRLSDDFKDELKRRWPKGKEHEIDF